MPTNGRRLAAPDPWGTRFRNKRLSLRLSQIAISKATGLTQQAISRIECNGVVPRERTLQVLAESVGETVDDLFPEAARPVVAQVA